MDGNKLLAKVDGSRGAPMGRVTLVANPLARCRLFKVRLDSGGYDRGGAYWGGPDNLYCIFAAGMMGFCRAADRDAAKKIFKGRYPSIKFFR